MQTLFSNNVGIDDMSLYVPNLYLSINELATERGIEPAKLEKGLGLIEMAVPDANEDVITMAAEAVIDLIKKNNLEPSDIGRIYVGTESMVDGSKPISSYILGILSQYYGDESKSVLRHCDVIDMTFACIGAVDAMQNCLDWIRIRPNKKAIVIATDWAKYELNSTGEYTQGAGAIAILLSDKPRILSISKTLGVSSQCEHDFYKPIRRSVNTSDSSLSNGVDSKFLGREIVKRHKETPIYDGQFSNLCYSNRIQEAFSQLQSLNPSEDLLSKWSKLIFHLPYAYHARRVFVSVFVQNLEQNGKLASFLENIGMNHGTIDLMDGSTLRTISKSQQYREFISKKISSGDLASSKIGNLYTGSIFLSLLSCLSLEDSEKMENSKLGFFAYGSGSKAKVFEGTVVQGYKNLIDRINLFQRLDNRMAINFSQYAFLHKGKLLQSLDKSSNRTVFHSSSGYQEGNRFARHYVLA